MFGAGVGVRRRSFDSGEIKRAADGGASIDCCCNYNAILAQSQMKLFRTEPAGDTNVILRLSLASTEILWAVCPVAVGPAAGALLSASVADALLHRYNASS